ncbi:MAG: DUF4214 domain-containing protein [Actinomycetota bacterium]
MRRLSTLVIIVVLAVMLVVLLGLAPPAAAQSQPTAVPIEEVDERGLIRRDAPEADITRGAYLTPCTHITDSLYRLYTAYFLREPDDDGWIYWLATYGSAYNTNLEVVSDSFAVSDEFLDLYGALSNEGFVTLVYHNVLERDPDDPGFAHWVTALNNGYSRGAMMIAFSESKEYVRKTGTTPPMAGYLMWYDRSFRYECGVNLSLRTAQGFDVPDSIPSAHVDIAVVNDSAATDYISADWSFIGPLFGPLEFPSRTYLYLWNIPVVENDRDLALHRTLVGEGEDLYWTVVFYDHPHSAERPGWESSVFFRHLA